MTCFLICQKDKKMIHLLCHIRGVIMNDEKKFEIEVLTRLTKIETLLRNFEGIEKKAEEAYNLATNNKKRLDNIEDNNKWLFRTAVGAVITGLIAIVLTFIK